MGVMYSEVKAFFDKVFVLAGAPVSKRCEDKLPRNIVELGIPEVIDSERGKIRQKKIRVDFVELSKISKISKLLESGCPFRLFRRTGP